MDDFFIHDGKSLKFTLETLKEGRKNPTPHGIVSEQLLRGERYQELLKECQAEWGEPFIQMLIVDECHHYRNPETNTHKVGSLLSMCAERVIMLSATPFNLRSSDLFNQLNMLNPSLFPDENLFRQLVIQICNVNQCIALLRKQDTGDYPVILMMLDKLKPLVFSNPSLQQDFNDLYSRLIQNEQLNIHDVVYYEKVLNLLNPISSSFTRTLKRDAIAHRVTREVKTLEVSFTEAEKEIYQSFIDVNMLRHQLNGVSERAFGLIANGLERIAASSIVALEQNIRNIMKQSDIDFEEILENDFDINDKSADAMRSVLKDNYNQLITKIHALNGVDTKYAVFKELIANVRSIAPDNPRILVFSFYIGTLKYLRKQLSRDGYKVALMYGKTPQDTPSKKEFDEDGFPVIGRSDIMKAFQNGDYDILLASEVGGEGLDFQFCSALINYDLPYNPMRIEQRIGRIDRMGQAADKIVIGNLCIENTIDMVINRVLLSRIDDATDLIGDLEPIITREMEEINQLILKREFSEEELAKRERELEARIEKEKATREEFDSQRYELVNDKGFREEFEENIKNSRVSPRESLLFTISFLKGINGCWSKTISDTAIEIHITKDLKEKLASYYRRMNLGSSDVEIKNLSEADSDLIIDFDGDSAYNEPDRLFVKPSGAWIHFMVDYIKALDSDNTSNLFHVASKKEASGNLEKGTYLVFIYDFEFVGFRNTNSSSYVLIDLSKEDAVVVDIDVWKNIILNAQNTKKAVIIDQDDLENMRAIADEMADQLLAEMEQSIVAGNDVKILSRIKAVKNLSEQRIRKHENNLIGASQKDAERLRRAILKEKNKTEEKLQILEKKRKLSSNSSLQGLVILEVV